MEKRTGKKISKSLGDVAVEFTATELEVFSSPVREGETAAAGGVTVDNSASALEGPEQKYSPEFLELAEPKLPALSSHGNRARLLMQSPNRLYFYWAVSKNPFHTLNRAFGGSGGYRLVLRLKNLGRETEEIHPVEPAGNWWFTVDPGTEYRAEIGFYAVNRPYIRVLYSNTVATPRKGPSPRSADTAEWRVPADRFARVLDAAGFARDAFDVALAGDDIDAAEIATRSAFAQFSGRRHEDFERVEASEIRYAMLALASGLVLEQLRGLISESLYLLLSSSKNSTGERALAALQERFEFDADEFEVEEEEGVEAVFGASLVNFPKRLKRSTRIGELTPVSSRTVKAFPDASSES